MRQSNGVLVAVLGTAVACGPAREVRHDTATSPASARLAEIHGASSASASTAGASAAASVASAGGAGAPAFRAPSNALSADPVVTAGDAPRAPRAVACYAGFAPSSTPRVDVVRLGVSCGPSGGLTELAHAAGAVDETGGVATLRWDADRGDCFRLFAVATEPVEDIVVQITEHGSPSSTTTQSRRWAVVGEEGPFCADRAGRFEATIGTHVGRGAVAASVWRGAHMVGKWHGAPPETGSKP